MKRFFLPLLAFSFGINALAITKDDVSQPAAKSAATFKTDDYGFWFEVSTVKPAANNETAIIIPDGYNSQTVAFNYDGLWNEDANVTAIVVTGTNTITQTTYMPTVETISIGQFVTKIEGTIFGKLKKNGKDVVFSNLKSVTINADTPPDITGVPSNGFDGLNDDVILFVPKASVSAYKASALAKHFKAVAAIGTNPDDITPEEPVQPEEPETPENPGTSTAVNGLEADKSFTVVGRKIVLNGEQRVQVYNITGRLVLDEVTEEATIEGNGIFIVRTATQTEKVSCK